MPTGDVPYPALPPSPAERLLEKARTRFPDLNTAEEKMVRAAAEGVGARVGYAVASQQEAEGDSIRWHPASSWSFNIEAHREHWTIRAAVVRWLCTDLAAVKLIHSKGLMIYGAVISGQLDFQQAHVPVPLLLIGCDILEPISAIGSHFSSLALQGCAGQGITADGARFDGWLFLQSGTVMAGEVSLVGATIGGDLDCTGGRFESPTGRALIADSLRVRGTVHLCEGFHGKGEVRLLGATIGGDLDCKGGRFNNPSGNALSADGLCVRGSVHLCEGFHAKGEVRLLGATIGCDLYCTGGRFESIIGKALIADRLRVRGGVNLNKKFHATGMVCLLGVTIGRDLSCTGGRFVNTNSKALIAQSARIGGNLLIRSGFQAQGEVDFGMARIGGAIDMGEWHCRDVHNPQADDTFIHGILDLSHCRLGTLQDDAKTIDCLKINKPTLLLHGFIYSTLAQDAPTDATRRLLWLRLHPEKDFTPQPYGHLARVLDSLGHADDARAIRVAAAQDAANYQLMQSLDKTTISPKHAKRLSWMVPFVTIAIPVAAWAFLSSQTAAWLVSIIWLILSVGLHYLFPRLMATTRWFGQKALDWLLGHGYHPLRPLWGMLIFFIIGWVVFTKCQPCIKPTTDQTIAAQTHSPRFQPMVYSADLLLPIIDLDQANLWRPDPGPPRCQSGWFSLPTAGECLRAYAWIHVLAGWTFSTFLIIGLAGLVKKELPEADSPNT